jgi:hypothetical protein
MPTVRHPRDREDVAGHPPAAVTVRGRSYDVARDDDTATVDLPTDADVRALASAYDLAADALRVAETCDVVKADGDVCGRDLPCPYHTDDA